MKPKLNPKKIRQLILKMAYEGQTPHIACAFSIVEILCALFEVMNFNPKDAERDYLILSKGHGAMALYACMFEMGHLNQEDIDNYAKDGSRLHGACEATIPGIDSTTGSLGHGLPIAVGIAYALKKQEKKQKVYCIVGDGEMQEGSCWEAVQFASNHDLNNLIIIIDLNGLQALGATSIISYVGNIKEHLDQFLIPTKYVDGHDIEALKEKLIFETRSYPIGIVTKTKKGYGVDFMTDNNEYHYKKIDHEYYQKALEQLS